MGQLISRQFQAALNHFLQEEGRGAQTRLATAKDIDRGYLNSISKGRQAGSDETRARIADHFGTTFEDMLALGRQILVERGELVPIGQNVIGQNIGTTSLPALGSPDKSLKVDAPRIGAETIGEAILKTLEVLQEASTHSDTLIGSINVFHEAVVMNKINLVLSNQMMAIESRVANIEVVLSDAKTVPRKLRKTACSALEAK